MTFSPIDTPFDVMMRVSSRAAVASVEWGITHADAPGTPLDAVDRARAATVDPVVLVPGYGASERSWSAVRRGLERDGFRVHVLDPLGCSLGAIEPLAVQLDAFVDDVLVAEPGARGVQVVGHSKGGLVAQAWIRDELAGGDAVHATRLVTLGTPSGGLPRTMSTNPVLGMALALGGPSSAAILQTEAGPFIDALRGVGIQRRVPTTAIFARGSDGIVDESTARIDGATNVALGDAPRHMQLLTDDAAYTALRGALLGAR